MKAFQIKRLLAVALIAGLPIACGSGSPTGPGIAGLSDDTTSALRVEPGLPPTAPEEQSPESEPVPDNGDPVADGTVPTDDGNAPSADTGRRPGPRPSDGPPTNDPLPDDDGSVPVPAPPAARVPPPASVPPPSQVDGARECLASAAEIMILRGSLPQPLYGESVLLEIAMLGKDGLEIKDSSCRGIAWSFDVPRIAADATITVSTDTRFATVRGPAGAYTIRATTPSGVSATVGITLQ